jgi:hypothetical protein
MLLDRVGDRDVEVRKTGFADTTSTAKPAKFGSISSRDGPETRGHPRARSAAARNGTAPRIRRVEVLHPQDLGEARLRRLIRSAGRTTYAPLHQSRRWAHNEITIIDTVVVVEVSMNRSVFPALLVGATLGVAAMPALAVTCYQVIDRTDTVIFRNSWTTVDLSEAGVRSRDAMRSLVDLLVIFDAPACVVVGRSTGARSGNLTVDEIVAEWRNEWGPNSYRTSSPNFGESSVQSTTPAPSAQSTSRMPSKSVAISVWLPACTATRRGPRGAPRTMKLSARWKPNSLLCYLTVFERLGIQTPGHLKVHR